MFTHFRTTLAHLLLGLGVDVGPHQLGIHTQRRHPNSHTREPLWLGRFVGSR